jgi:hypothetical protein
MQLNKNKQSLSSLVWTSEEVQEDSYKVTELVTSNKPLAKAEISLMPTCKERVKVVLGPEATSDISEVSLSVAE